MLGKVMGIVMGMSPIGAVADFVLREFMFSKGRQYLFLLIIDLKNSFLYIWSETAFLHKNIYGLDSRLLYFTVST